MSARSFQERCVSLGFGYDEAALSGRPRCGEHDGCVGDRGRHQRHTAQHEGRDQQQYENSVSSDKQDGRTWVRTSAGNSFLLNPAGGRRCPTMRDKRCRHPSWPFRRLRWLLQNDVLRYDLLISWSNKMGGKEARRWTRLYARRANSSKIAGPPARSRLER